MMGCRSGVTEKLVLRDDEEYEIVGLGRCDWRVDLEVEEPLTKDPVAVCDLQTLTIYSLPAGGLEVLRLQHCPRHRYNHCQNRRFICKSRGKVAL